MRYLRGRESFQKRLPPPFSAPFATLFQCPRDALHGNGGCTPPGLLNSDALAPQVFRIWLRPRRWLCPIEQIAGKAVGRFSDYLALILFRKPLNIPVVHGTSGLPQRRGGAKLLKQKWIFSACSA